MKKVLQLLPLLLLLNFIACKKAIENKKKDLLLDAITNGTWYVSQFKEDSTDITIDFYGYNFNFKDDGTVLSSYGALGAAGTWSGDVNNYTITSDFPGADDPLKKLNGVWKITTSYSDYVEAERPTTSGKYYLHLQKRP